MWVKSWYLSFSAWFISFNKMSSRSIHAIAKGKIFFFFTAEWYSIAQMSHTFIYSSTDGHLGYFHMLVNVNNAAMNIEHLCSLPLVFGVSLDILVFPEVWSLGQKGDPVLIFWGISILLPTVAAPTCIPTNTAKGFPFLHILTSTCSLIHWWQPFLPEWSDISLWFSFAFLWWLVMFSHVY